MKVTTNDEGNLVCTLTSQERRQLGYARSILDQLAFHNRPLFAYVEVAKASTTISDVLSGKIAEIAEALRPDPVAKAGEGPTTPAAEGETDDSQTGDDKEVAEVVA